jgi:hypothetical protein
LFTSISGADMRLFAHIRGIFASLASATILQNGVRGGEGFVHYFNTTELQRTNCMMTKIIRNR